MAPLICQTIVAPHMAGLRAARDAAARADLVEVRLDALAEPDAVGAVTGRRHRVVVTCRPDWEGGQFLGSETERERILREALAAGAEYVDVEWRAPFRDQMLRDAPDRVVLSLHDFAGVPADVEALAREMSATRAAVVKIAAQGRSLVDVVRLRHLGRELGARRPVVVIAMGEAGVVSRLLASRFGSCWIYAGDGVAPGQLPVARLLDEFRVRRLGADTAVCGIVGRPVCHSLSPAMHNAAFEATGVDAVYVPLEAANFDDFGVAARDLEVAGASVTAPFKRDAWTACRHLDPAAQRLGAVNTLRLEEDGGWAGRNTDVAGFLAPLAGRILAGTRATVLGAGGAARAVAAGLVSRGAFVTVRARRLAEAEAVAAMAGARSGAWPPPLGSWDVLVNATPVGTWPSADASPVPAASLDGGLVYDLVYNPPESRLVREARARGLVGIGGLDMLVSQAAEQFSWWTGVPAPVTAMRAAAERALADRMVADATGTR